jgi:hypothetical protein
MFSVNESWNPQQKQLKSMIRNEGMFEEAKELILYLHSMVHSRTVYGIDETTLEDEVWEDIRDISTFDFITMPTIKDVTIARNNWQITRIEDLTVNILIANDKQVLDSNWLNRLGVDVTDTGNAMSDDEIISLSNKLNMQGLQNYRNAVGIKTRKVLSNLEFCDLKRKATAEGLKRILDEGGVIDHPESIWLLDFWGKKDVAGLINMPVTRHQVVHLNDSLKLKKKCARIK